MTSIGQAQPAATGAWVAGQRRESGFWLRLGLRLVLPLADLIAALAAFIIIFPLMLASVVLVAFFFLGVPMFTLTGAVARGISAFDRLLLGHFLGVEFPPTPPWPRGIRASLRDAPTWRAIAYHLIVHWVLALVSFTVVTTAWGVSLALLSMPWWLRRVPSGRADLGFTHVTDVGTAWAWVVAGVVVGAISLALPWGFGALAGAVGRGMLGPTSGELARRVETLEQTRARVVDAAEAERQRIERNLHDGAQQRLISLAMNLGRARARYDEDPAASRQLLEEAHGDAKRALAELRDLARGLHPAVLTDRGLDAALSGLAASCPVPVRLRVDVAPRVSPTIEAIAYFVVSEALANVAKHARARAVDVEVARVGSRLRVRVRDDGVGGARVEHGGGIAGLADRASGVDGSFHLDSPAGGPTELTVELPCES